jgi:hypothetical protein
MHEWHFGYVRNRVGWAPAHRPFLANLANSDDETGPLYIGFVLSNGTYAMMPGPVVALVIFSSRSTTRGSLASSWLAATRLTE